MYRGLGLPNFSFGLVIMLVVRHDDVIIEYQCTGYRLWKFLQEVDYRWQSAGQNVRCNGMSSSIDLTANHVTYNVAETLRVLTR